MRRFDASAPDFANAFAAFLAEPRGSPGDVEAAVVDVIAAVRAEGLPAVLRFSSLFDHVELTEDTVRVSAEEIAAGAAQCPIELRAAIAFRSASTWAILVRSISMSV